MARPSRRGSTSSTPPTCTGAAARRRFLGEVLRGRPRDSYVLATKLFFPMDDGRTAASRARRCASRSTRRCTAADRPRGPVPVPPLRRLDAARGDDGGADRGRPAGKARYIGFSEWTRGADPGVARYVAEHGREVRLQPAAVLDALARAGAGGHSPVRGERHRADRLVAARAGRADREVPAGRAAAAGSRATSERMGSFIERVPDETVLGRGAAAAGGRRAARAHDGAARAGAGCCGSRTSPRRSSGRAGPSRSARTLRLREWSSTSRLSPRSTQYSDERPAFGRHAPRGTSSSRMPSEVSQPAEAASSSFAASRSNFASVSR